MANHTSRLLLGMVTLLLLAATLLGLSLWQQQRRDQTSSQLALTVTQQALTTGDGAFLARHAHPDLQAGADAAQLDAYLAYVVRQLGELQSLQSISGSSAGGWLPGFGAAATASYEIRLQFAMAPATAVIELRQVDGHWQVREFMVEALALYQ